MTSERWGQCLKVSPAHGLLAGLLAALVVLLLVPAPAAADIGPSRGQKRISVAHALEALEGEALAEYALFLVTTNAREWWSVEVKPVSRAGGPLEVPSGYMDRSVLAALTEAQLVELSKLALPLAHFAPERDKLAALDDAALAAHFRALGWETAPEDMEPFKGKARGEVPLMAFFMRDDVATSGTLGFREDVPNSYAPDAVMITWRVVGIEGGEVKLTEVERKGRDATGQWVVLDPAVPGTPGGGDGSWWELWVGLALVAAGVTLTLTLRRRPVGVVSAPSALESR